MDVAMLKGDIVAWTGLSKDALHIFFSVAIQLSVCLLLRRSLSSPLPWFCVLIMQSINELLDVHSRGGWDRMTEYLKADMQRDFIITIAVPTALLVFGWCSEWRQRGEQTSRETIDEVQ